MNEHPLKITWRRPPLYEKQKQAIFNESRYSFIEAGTKCGKTFGCIVWLLEQALVNGGDARTFWWIAPVYPQAKIAYRRLKKYLKKYKEIYSVNESELSIRFINGSIMQFKSGEKPDNLYGDDVFAAVIDEASRMREESWVAVRSTLTATKGPVRAIGNVKGRSNWFYKLCRRAQSGDDAMHYSKITAYDAVEAGVLDPEEIEDAKKLMPPNVFDELYLAKPSDDQGNPFGLKSIDSCISVISKNPAIAFGVDLGRKFDFTVITGIDAMGSVCFLERFKLPWAEAISRIQEVVGSTRCSIDATGLGDAILDTLQKESSYNNYTGFIYTSHSKQIIMEGLALAMHRGNIRFPEGVLADELREFRYEYTRNGVIYSAPEGLHDDCVCSLAQAWSLAKGGDPTQTYKDFARNVKQ